MTRSEGDKSQEDSARRLAAVSAKPKGFSPASGTKKDDGAASDVEKWASVSRMTVGEFACVALGLEPSDTAQDLDQVRRYASMLDGYSPEAKIESYRLIEVAKRKEQPIDARFEEISLRRNPPPKQHQTSERAKKPMRSDQYLTHIAIIKRLLFAAYSRDVGSPDGAGNMTSLDQVVRDIMTDYEEFEAGHFPQRDAKTVENTIKAALAYDGPLTKDTPYDG